MKALAYEWLNEDVAVRVGASSYDQYKADIDNILCRLVADIEANEFSYNDLQAAVDGMATLKTLRSERKKPKTYATRRIRRAAYVLKRVIEYGERMGYIHPLPHKTRSPRAFDYRSSTTLKHLSTSDAKKLYSCLISIVARPEDAVVDGMKPNGAGMAGDWQRYALGCLLGLTCGLRVGEACAITRKNIDFDTSTLLVEGTVSTARGRSGKAYVTAVGYTKTKASERKVPLSRDIASLLDLYAPKTACIVPGGYTRNSVASTRGINAWLKRVLNALDLPSLSFHALRHTFATRLLDSGVDMKTISELLGHTDVSTTANIYVHPDDKSKAAAVARLDW
jgi:integrase